MAAQRATKITVAVTDVPAGKETALASGPSLPDPTTVAHAEHILTQYSLREKLPSRLTEWLDAGKMPETPKRDHPAFLNSYFCLLLGMDDLFHAAHHTVEAQGYVACCDNSTDEWPVEKAASYLLEQLDGWQRENPGHRVALIADGEVSSPVTGKGIGGRNSAFVLACVEKIAGRKITVLSAGTDGVDGNSPAAGAVADGETLARAKAQSLDPAAAFAQSDASTFFDKLGDAVVTGPTGNNLRDLRILSRRTVTCAAGSSVASHQPTKASRLQAASGSQWFSAAHSSLSPVLPDEQIADHSAFLLPIPWKQSCRRHFRHLPHRYPF